MSMMMDGAIISIPDGCTEHPDLLANSAPTASALAGISGHFSRVWLLQKTLHKQQENLPAPKPFARLQISPVHCSQLVCGWGWKAENFPQGWASSELSGGAPWGAGGDTGTCPTWWWGISSCARSARRRRRQRSRTGGCACREGEVGNGQLGFYS